MNSCGLAAAAPSRGVGYYSSAETFEVMKSAQIVFRLPSWFRKEDKVRCLFYHIEGGGFEQAAIASYYNYRYSYAIAIAGYASYS